MSIEHGWSLSVGEGAGCMKVSQKDHHGLWGAFVGDFREPLNKKEGFGVGLQVVLVTKSAPGHFVPPYSQYCCDFPLGMRNGVEKEGKTSEVAQSCLTLCDPMHCSLPGSSVHGIFEARILEWVAIPSPGDLPNPGIEPRYPALQADALPSKPPGKPWDRREESKSQA